MAFPLELDQQEAEAKPLEAMLADIARPQVVIPLLPQPEEGTPEPQGVAEVTTNLLPDVEPRANGGQPTSNS